MIRAAGHRLPGSPLEKRIGEMVRLRALWWDGPLPQPGDELVTSTGRRYLIDRTSLEMKKQEQTSFTIWAIVVPSNMIGGMGRTFRWSWTRKSRRKPKALK